MAFTSPESRFQARIQQFNPKHQSQLKTPQAGSFFCHQIVTCRIKSDENCSVCLYRRELK